MVEQMTIPPMSRLLSIISGFISIGNVIFHSVTSHKHFDQYKRVSTVSGGHYMRVLLHIHGNSRSSSSTSVQPFEVWQLGKSYVKP